MTQKHRQTLISLIFLIAGCSLLRTEGFSWSLDVLYGGLGINKLKVLIKKRYRYKKNSAVLYFFPIFGQQTLDPDWIRIWICIRIRIHLKCYAGSGSGFNESGSTALLASLDNFLIHLPSGFLKLGLWVF
jgi:hypothetical protein